LHRFGVTVHDVNRAEGREGRLLAVPCQRLELPVFLFETTHEDGAAVLFAHILQGAQQQRTFGGANQGDVPAQILQVARMVAMRVGEQYAVHTVKVGLPFVEEVILQKAFVVDAAHRRQQAHDEQLVQPARPLGLDELFVVVHQTAEVLPKVQPQGEVAVL
jgi:hypothetical protein